MVNKSTPSHLLGVLLISCVILIADANSDLDTLCNNKPVELRKISQVQSLIQQSKQDSAGACARYAASLADLDNILSFVQTGKTCDLELVEKIRRFQQNYLVEGGNHELAPLALRQFFLALGFQISAECKIVMINNFETDITSRISEADYEIFTQLEQSGANPLNGEVYNYDDILLPSEFSVGTDVEPIKLLVKVQTGDLVKKLTKECRTKFKPIYDKLIMPLIQLSNLGYNYQGEMLERELVEFRQNKLIQRWYYILQTCESFLSISIYEDASDDSVERKAITLISKTEAEKLTPVSLADDAKEESIQYEPPTSHESDELWILTNQDLDKLMADRRNSATEADRIRSKLIKKVIARVKKAFMSGELISSMKSGLGEQLKPFLEGEEMVLAVDGAVSDGSGNDIDSSVSGTNWKGKGKAKKISTYNLPPKPTFIPKVENGSRTSVWLWDSTVGRLSPSRRHIFWWTLTLCSVVLIIVASLFLAG